MLTSRVASWCIHNVLSIVKILIASIVCLLIGYQIGRWLPQSQNIALSNKTEALEEQLKRGGGGTGARNIDFLDAMLGSVPGGDLTEVSSNTVKQVVFSTNETIIVTQFVEVVEIITNVVDSAKERRDRWGALSMQERMDKAEEMFKLRSDLAKEDFFGKLKEGGIHVGRERRRDFDLVVDTMNYHMKTTIDNWVSDNEAKEKIYADDGIGLMTDAMNVIKLNYEQMDNKMPEGWRDAAGEDFRLFDFIQPSVGKSMLGMDGKLKSLRGRAQDRDGPPF